MVRTNQWILTFFSWNFSLPSNYAKDLVNECYVWRAAELVLVSVVES